MEQKDTYYNKAEYIETVSITNYSHNPLNDELFKFNFYMHMWFNEGHGIIDFLFNLSIDYLGIWK